MSKVQKRGRFQRGVRAAVSAFMALVLALSMTVFPAGSAYAAGQGDESGASGEGADDIRIAVLSDTHYYPLNYVSECEDYDAYVGGDPKMLEESGSILDAALSMVEEDAPDVLLVSGDLTKDGEKLGHEQLAERFQKIEDETDTEVFVINGNHDIYNYQDSCTFENGKKESAETTTPDEFKQIYRNFGYDGNWDAQYFVNPNAGSGEQAGGLSYSVDLGKFTIVAIDSGMYSPDAHTGYDTNEHVTAGRVDEDLLPWVVDQTKQAEAEGDTVIGLMHHGLVPHFSMEDQVLSEYVVEDWKDVASQLADAGMRYIFTGHMHANDIAQFTSNAGNTITDLETGSLSSWMSPVRTVTLEKGAALDDGTARTKETFDVSSESVKSISFKDHTGKVTQIDDLKSYTQEKLYPDTLFNNMANGMLRPVLQEIGEQGIRPWLAENLPDVDIDALALGAVRDALAGGMDIELGTGIGRVHVEYRNGGIQLQPSGTAGLIGSATITDAQILRLVDDVLNTVEAKYIDDPDWLLGQVDQIVTQVSEMGVDSLDPAQHTIYDLVFVVLTGHYAGHENPPAWVDGALEYIQTGDIVEELIDGLIDDVMPIVDTLLADNSIDTGIAFSGLWKTVIDSATDDGNLKSTLDLFGFDEAAIRTAIEGLVGEYMSPSFLTGMGSLIDDIASSMLYDSNFTDDTIDGEGVTIVFDGTTSAPEPSVDNGLLPTQVTMTLGGDTQTERNFRWYTGTNVEGGTVQVATDSSFANVVAEVQADSEQVVKPKTQLNLGLVTTYGTQKAEKHSATVSGLDDGAVYYYRVGDKDNGWWSAGYQFTTGDADDGDDAFTFVNVNDSQGMVASDYDVYKNTLAAADATFPAASFTVHGGDFVDDGANEDYWTWALDDANGVAQGMSMTPAAGNHEAKSDVEGITDANPIVSHFNLANVPQGQDLSTGAYYSYVYKNATFVVLNTNDLASDESLSQAQYNWAYDTLSSAGTQWKIVLMHKSPYSNGPHQDDADVAAIRSQVDALAAVCDVDLVLSGHDHVYNRTPFLSHGAEQETSYETQTYKGVNYETALNPNGTAFVIAGTAGVKNYAQAPSASIPSEVALDLSVPVYSGVTIDGDHLYYRAYKVSGGSSTLVDSFAISKAEQDVPAWKQVEDLIAALPEQSAVTLDDEAAITAARAAYDKLSAEDKKRVSNYDRLTAAEKMLSVLKGTAGKRTVTVSNANDFVAAVNDSSVGTILTEGSFGFDEGNLFDDGNREVYVNRDLVVGGSGELKFCRFHVQNGATLVLKDSVYVNDTRTQGSWFDALNPVEVNAGGTLVTQGSVSLRTEYGTGGKDEGVAVKLMGSGATAILGSSGTYWGSEAAVLSTVEGTTLVIDGGTYNAKNGNHVVIDTHGNATVNGGTISSMWVSGTLRVNGGTFKHQDSASSNWTPLAVSGGDAYITGGTFETYGGRDGNASIKLENGARLHVLAVSSGNVRIGGVTPYVGSVSTQDYKNVTIGYAASNGWAASDGIYRVEGAASASSVEGLAGLPASQMSNERHSGNGDYMDGTLPEGTSTVFGKYWVYGNGKSAPGGSGIIGDGQVIAYGPARTIQNNPVEGVTIDGDAVRLVDLNQQGAETLRLTGYTTPANAFDNGITWSSDNEQTASVSTAAGQGVVTLKRAGGANITARSDSNPNASASVEVIAVKPTLDGPEKLDEDTASATFTADKGFASSAYDSRLTFKYSVSDNTVASIDEDTGALAKLSAGTVRVTATLYLDGEPTDVTVERDVVCKMKPEISVEDVDRLLDVQVSDANEAMAGQHAAQTFDALIANTEGQNDSYAIGEVYSEDAPAGNLVEGAAQLLGLAKPDKVWKADVTIQAAPYVAAFDAALGLDAGTHEVSGDTSKTVTLVWSDGASAEDAVAGWTLEDPNATPVTFSGVCATPLQDIAVTPDEGNDDYVYDGSGKPFAFAKAPSDDIEGFTVEYRPAGSDDEGAWTTETPVDAGSYDVRVTRDEDGAYAAFEQVFEDGVKIAKAKLATPDVRYTEGDAPGSIKVILQNGDADTYCWSESDDKADAMEAEDACFEVGEPGTYYAWGAGDENHEDSDLAAATIVQVTFDDNDGAEGDEAENAVFTKGAAQVLLPAGQCLNSWGGLPAVSWEGHEFSGWRLPNGRELTALTAIDEGVTATAQWAVEPGAVTPAVPTGQAVAKLGGVSVALHDINELHGQDSGDRSHPDVTFAASGDGAQALLADSFAVGQPQQGADGTWSAEVTLDAQKYLDAYAAMGDSAYGVHYFASKDESGDRTFALAYDEGEHAWKLAEGQRAAYTFDITCLTLRPAELVKYTGGAAGDQSHFPDARVVDGQGDVYTLGQLNALLDEGELARVAYFDAEGNEVSDDTEPGVYTARIVVEGTGPTAFAANGSDEASVNVNVGDREYRFALEPSTLIVRSVSDADDAESGALGVPLLASDADASAIAAAVNGAAGGVAAQLPAGTKVYVNDREAGELTGEALGGVRLFSDELLGAEDSGGVDRLQALKDRAAKLGFQIGDNADFQYLDLVDAAQSNLWVSSSDGATIYWKVPEGADVDSLEVLHFKELHREYGVGGADLQDQIDACTVEEMALDTTHAADGYVSFHVGRAGFSPFVMTWDKASVPPAEKATVTFDANGGELPEGAPESVAVTVGGTIASLPEPTRGGYTFDGWQTEDGSAFIAGETAVEGDMELSATWTANEYEVTLDAAGGVVDGEASTAVKATYDAALGKLPEPTREGYTFDGWFTEAQGGKRVTADTVYKTAGESTYYAHWTLDEAAQKVVVTLDAGEGVFAGGDSAARVEVAKGGSLGISDIPEVGREGYELAGWYLDEACEEPVVFFEDIDPAEGIAATVFDEDTTIYAKWLEDIGSDVSFDGIERVYTGKGVTAEPSFGTGFPASESDRVRVLYRTGAEPWTDGAPVSAGSYDVKFVYEGSDDYAPFEKEYPAGVVIVPAALAQSGLVADPSQVAAGTKLADIKLAGATVTMADGTEVSGSWAWVDADGSANASGTHQAMFTPAEGAANYLPLYADVQVDVKAAAGGNGSGDGSGNGGSGDDVDVNVDNVNDGQAAGGKGAVLTGENAGFLMLGGAALVAAVAAAVLALLRKKSRDGK